MYPAIEHKFRAQDETFKYKEHSYNTISDFWQWAYSDIAQNAIRGKLAEYIVAMALEIENLPSGVWDSFDLLLPNGLKIEVKSSAYLQSWYQKNLSAISFDIKETKKWSSESNIYETDIRRQSDIYVFCLLKHLEKSTLDPMNLVQWEFYVAETSKINEVLGHKKRLTYNDLVLIGAKKCNYPDLKDVIYNID